MTDLVDTFIENRWIVQPNHANIVETAHGGNVVKWMDEAGAMAAMRFAGETCVTVRMNSVDFKRPIRTGDTALIQAYVYDAGRTSVKVRLRAFRENLRTGERELTSESYFVYVAIDEDRDTVEVPELTVSTERGEELYEAAVEASGSAIPPESSE
ncbi:MAG: acyl-CoA thioesterase [Halobacteriota archaeon]